MSENSHDAFFDSWHIYQKVVAANHMFHREIAQDLASVLAARFGSQPFSFLDLGCGDAASLAPILKGLPLQRYKGVDLSETALALARKNLAGLSCPVEFAHSDISAALSAETGSYDVIHSSFALHHLRTQEKAQFFRQAAPRLKEGGLLLLVDVMREEDEGLEIYLQRYCAWLRNSWTALDANEKDYVCSHLVSSDRPETASALQALAMAAGLEQASQAARYNWHRVFCFTRA
jgi:SAM-dependent methyltransferase